MTVFNPGHIFIVYRKRYNLNIDFELNDTGQCYFYWNLFYGGEKIVFDNNYVLNVWKNPKRKQSLMKRSGRKKIGEIALWALLHEIGHAIDCQEDWSRYIREANIRDIKLYKSDVEYHDSLPFEKRADKFARTELSFWLK